MNLPEKNSKKYREFFISSNSIIKMQTDFIPIDYDYFDFDGRNFIRVIGRNPSGKRICVIDSCDVYLWAILKDKVSKEKINNLIEKILKIKIEEKSSRKTKVEKVEVKEKNFLGKKVRALKVFATNYKDLHAIADKMDFPEIQNRRGYDLGFVTHYIIEKKMIPMQWYSLNGELLNNSIEFGGIDSSFDVDLCIKLEKLERTGDKNFVPKVLAYDIETDELQIGKGEILMVSLYGKDFKKVITWKKFSEKKDASLPYVEYVKDESELIEKFTHYVRGISPDFLVGYFSDGFDLPYLKARAEKNEVKLSLGLDDSQPRFFKSGAVKGMMTGKIKGIVHVDLLKFIRTAYSQYMQSETLSLNEVANEFLGERKIDFKFRHSSKIPENEWEKYFEYNLHDSYLTYGLFSKMFPDLTEFSRILSEPVFEISRNGMSKNVESYIIHNLEKFNEIPEKKPMHDEISKRRGREKYEGAFVFEPKPGLYDEVVIFDFTSFWPSIIVTFNLSKSTLLKKKGKNSTVAEVLGKKEYFSKTPGFFPEMLNEIIELRKKYKKELKQKPDAIKEARSNAFKLLANASYGYQGFFGARYYCPEASGATTAISREFIQESIKKIDAQGYKTIYSDTDSIAFLINKKTQKQTLDFLEKLNSHLPGIMELELEDFYKRGIWVTKRSGDFGAKKKYALINYKGKLKIRGFETVRRDWCNLARKLQNEVIKHILEEGNETKALESVKDVIKKLKQGKILKEELIIKTQLKKPLSEYVAVSPHVIAARKMKEKEIPIGDGGLVSYYIAETKEKKKLVREKVKLPEEEGMYDIEYYLNHQVLPAVENIFHVFNVHVEKIINEKNQTSLGDFGKKS